MESIDRLGIQRQLGLLGMNSNLYEFDHRYSMYFHSVCG